MKKKKRNQKRNWKFSNILTKLIPCLTPEIVEYLFAQYGTDGARKVMDGNTEEVIGLCTKALAFLKEFKSTKHPLYLYKKNIGELPARIQDKLLGRKK